jgi:hypothetical protein
MSMKKSNPTQPLWAKATITVNVLQLLSLLDEVSQGDANGKKLAGQWSDALMATAERLGLAPPTGVKFTVSTAPPSPELMEITTPAMRPAHVLASKVIHRDERGLIQSIEEVRP